MIGDQRHAIGGRHHQPRLDPHPAQVAGLVSAAASGGYPNLAAALAAPPPPPRDADEIFDRCVLRLIDGALAGQPRDRSPEGGTDPPRGVMTPG